MYERGGSWSSGYGLNTKSLRDGELRIESHNEKCT